MKYSILLASIIVAFGLTACDRPATVVNVPVQGQAGPPGATGMPGATGVQGNTGTQGATGTQGDTGTQGVSGVQGYEGAKGDTGKTGGDTVIVVPAQSEQK